MHRTSLASITLIAVLANPGYSAAQDWLGRLARSAAETAAQGVVNNAVSAVVNGSAPRQGETSTQNQTPSPPAASHSRRQEEPQTVPASNFAAPAPINFTPAMRNPNDMRFGPEQEAAKKAYEDFGKIACNDCEGGYAYETWIRHALPALRGYQVLERRIGAMAMGESLDWTGSRDARYALTVVGEHPIGDWPCKQVKWTGDRGVEHAERLGLFCRKGETWIDVF